MIRFLTEYIKFCNAKAYEKKLYKFFLACIVFMRYKNPFKLINIDNDKINFKHLVLFNVIQLMTISRFFKLMVKSRKNKKLLYNKKHENTKPNVFYKLNTEQLYVEDIERIIPYCFLNFINLKEVIIGKDAKYICCGAFQDCISLKKVFIPNTLSKIETDAFANCINLKQIIFYEVE